MLSHHERAAHGAPLWYGLRARPVLGHGRPRRGKEAQRRRRGGRVGYHSDRVDVGRVYGRVCRMAGPR